MASKVGSRKASRARKIVEQQANEVSARLEGMPKKKFTPKDLLDIQPLTDNQKRAFQAYDEGFNLALVGTAGTGKSFVGMYFALQDVLDPDSPYDRVIIVRSSVPTREIGFLKGTEEEKMEVYEAPYHDICFKLTNLKTAYEKLKENGYIEFINTSFCRGVTFDNAIIVYDEAQSNTFHELNTIMTRLGENSKIIVCGDINQNDLLYKKNDQSGFSKFLRVASKIESFSMINFTREDIVRSDIVYDWIVACEDDDNEDFKNVSHLVEPGKVSDSFSRAA